MITFIRKLTCQIITPFRDKGNHKEHRRIVFFIYKISAWQEIFEISVRTKTKTILQMTSKGWIIFSDVLPIEIKTDKLFLILDLTMLRQWDFKKYVPRHFRFPSGTYCKIILNYLGFIFVLIDILPGQKEINLAGVVWPRLSMCGNIRNLGDMASHSERIKAKRYFNSNYFFKQKKVNVI